MAHHQYFSGRTPTENLVINNFNTLNIIPPHYYLIKLFIVKFNPNRGTFNFSVKKIQQYHFVWVWNLLGDRLLSRVINLSAVPACCFSWSEAGSMWSIRNKRMKGVGGPRKPASQSLIPPRTKQRSDAICATHSTSPAYLVYVIEFFKSKHFL